MGRSKERRIIKGIEEIFGGDGYVHDLDFADSFMGAYVCQNLSNSVLYVQVLVCQLYFNKTC